MELEDSSLGTESPLLRGPRRILWVALNAVAAKNATGFCSVLLESIVGANGFIDNVDGGIFGKTSL